MTILQEHQFEILPNLSATDGFVFGADARVGVNEDGFDPGETEWLSQDKQNSRRGVNGFGRDVKVAKTWVWESYVNAGRVADAVQTIEDFEGAWGPDEIMMTPGAVTAVRYQLAGRTRRIYGRPRRFAAPPTNEILVGKVDITHDFALVDAHTYDDVASSANVLFNSSAPAGGFILPAAPPLVSLPGSTNGNGSVYVGGNARAYPKIRLNGAWVNPTISTPDWTIKWTGTIPTLGWIEIDTRPWQLTVLDQAGASQVKGLARQTYLEDIYFKPKTINQVTLGGAAPTGTASAYISWRNTWTSI